LRSDFACSWGLETKQKQEGPAPPDDKPQVLAITTKVSTRQMTGSQVLSLVYPDMYTYFRKSTRLPIKGRKPRMSSSLGPRADTKCRTLDSASEKQGVILLSSGAWETCESLRSLCNNTHLCLKYSVCLGSSSPFGSRFQEGHLANETP
jgi:hypothetical protein